jgi:hypothetical protein
MKFGWLRCTQNDSGRGDPVIPARGPGMTSSSSWSGCWLVQVGPVIPALLVAHTGLSSWCAGAGPIIPGGGAGTTGSTSWSRFPARSGFRGGAGLTGQDGRYDRLRAGMPVIPAEPTGC